jgi:hypothetical protein
MSGFADLEAVARDATSVWAADASIRAEFGSLEAYQAFRRAESRGTCRILGQPNAAAILPDQAKPPAVDAEAATQDAERTWAADASVRSEFNGNKAAYLAFRRADARKPINIIGRKVVGSANDVARAVGVSQMTSSAGSLAERQAQVRQENVGRQFAGLPPLDVPQQ